ncbi:MAG: hypothetical protein L6Q54_13210 [Leptospiraceae bacterium]|nr:hypothetical protein [Leptospiraceae bacterium]MCK6382193.1 hypothetical protein [Leptospiraceae bacterium]NUM42771.1 hypothetical protein [Leptospiraceae bacterium]
MAKKDRLFQAAGTQINRALGNKTDNPVEGVQSTVEVSKKEPVEKVNKKEIVKNHRFEGKNQEKLLPKKSTLYNVKSVMRLEDYTSPKGGENKPKKYLILGGFIAALWLIWLFWPQKHAIFMDVNKMTPDKVSQMDPDKDYDFKAGQDFYVYYRKGWSTPKTLSLKIYKTEGGKEEIHSYVRSFKKDAEKAQTYYDETFFDSPGKYEVEIRNEKDEVLAVKKFTIN